MNDKQRLLKLEENLLKYKEMLEDLHKSNYGTTKDGKFVSLYTDKDNIQRKMGRTGVEVEGAGGNRAQKQWASSGRGSTKSQIDRQVAADKAKNKKQPIKTLADMSPEEKQKLEAQYGTKIKKGDKEYGSYKELDQHMSDIMNEADFQPKTKHPLEPTAGMPEGKKLGERKTSTGFKLKSVKKEEVMKVDANGQWSLSKDRCWDGYKPAPGKKAYEKGSCEKVKKEDKDIVVAEEGTNNRKTYLETFGKTEDNNYVDMFFYNDGTLDIISSDNLSDEKFDSICGVILNSGFEEMNKSQNWTPRKEHKSDKGGLTEAGRKSYNKKTGGNLKAPQPQGGPRKRSFCARNKGQIDMHNIDCRKNPDKRACKARKRWKC